MEIALKVTKRESLKPRYATLSKIYANGELIDEGIVIYFKAPNSFTGEDIVEFQCHGGVTVSSLVLKALINEGARAARAGEFSKRAVLSGKMDASKALAVAKMIETKSEDGVKLIAKHLRGDLGEFVNQLREELVTTLAYVEVNIDYAEEDLPSNLIEQIKKRLSTNSQKIANILRVSKNREGLIEGFRISIIGKPNVGKSSLLNTLLSYERAIISDIAGTTRDTIEEEIKIGSHLVRFVDTAGIRDSSDKIEAIGIERSKKAVEESDIVIALFDNSRVFDKDDEEILHLIQKYKSSKRVIVAINKCDLEPKFNREVISEKFIEISREDISPLIDRVEEILDSSVEADELVLISNWQVDLASRAKEAIDRASNLLDSGELELFAFEINEAIDAISQISKPFDRDEILDSMFGEFCLGK